MLEKHGIACDLMHGFNWDKWTTGKPAERLALIPAGQEHIRRGERQRTLDPFPVRPGVSGGSTETRITSRPSHPASQ